MGKYSDYAMNKIKELRIKRNVTQEELAKFLGISYQAYAHYEKGRRVPDVDTMIMLSLFFNISLNDLFGLQES